MSRKIQARNSAEAIAEMAREEFPKRESLVELKNVFRKLNWGTVEITVVAGEIENIKITKNYKPLSSVDELEEIG